MRCYWRLWTDLLKLRKSSSRRPSMMAVRPVIASNGALCLEMRPLCTHNTSRKEEEGNWVRPQILTIFEEYYFIHIKSIWVNNKIFFVGFPKLTYFHFLTHAANIFFPKTSYIFVFNTIFVVKASDLRALKLSQLLKSTDLQHINYLKCMYNLHCTRCLYKKDLI